MNYLGAVPFDTFIIAQARPLEKRINLIYVSEKPIDSSRVLRYNKPKRTRRDG